MNEVRVLLSAVLLTSGVAAAVAAAMIRFTAEERISIASVRLDELAEDYAAQAARTDAVPEETANAVRAWAFALEDALSQVAKRHRAVLLPARAVAAGAPDLTAQVEAALAAATLPPAMQTEPEPLP